MTILSWLLLFFIKTNLMQTPIKNKYLAISGDMNKCVLKSNRKSQIKSKNLLVRMQKPIWINYFSVN